MELVYILFLNICIGAVIARISKDKNYIKDFEDSEMTTCKYTDPTDMFLQAYGLTDLPSSFQV